MQESESDYKYEGVPYKKTLVWKVQNLLVREPRRLRTISVAVSFIGFYGQMLAAIFAAFGSFESRVIRIIFSALCAVGAMGSLWADISMAGLWGLIGTPLTVLGLSLFPVAIGIGPDAGTSVAAGSVFSVGISLLIAGAIFFIVQGVEDFRRPIFGMHNAFLWGSIIMIVGALVSFVPVSLYFPGVTSFRGYDQNILIIALMMLTSGFGLLVFANLQWLTNNMHMVLHRFPSTSLLKDNPGFATVYFVSSIISGISCFCLSIFVIFAVPNLIVLDWPSVVCLGVTGICRMLMLVSHVPAKDVLYIIGNALCFVGLCIETSFFSLLGISLVPDFLGTSVSAGVFQIVGGSILLLRSILLSRSHSFFAVGNHLFFAEFFQVLAGVCLIVVATTGTGGFLQLNAISLLHWSMICLCHASNTYDVSWAFNFHDKEWSPDLSIPPEVYDESDWARQVPISSVVDVIIVGAGPAGLTCANEMGRRNVKTILFDHKSQVVPDSRFFICNGHTMEGMKRLGVADSLLERGQPVTFGYGNNLADGMAHEKVTVYANTLAYPRKLMTDLGSETSRLSASRTMNSVWGFQPCQRVMQSVQEACLLEKARTYESVTVNFSHRLVDFRILAQDEGAICLIENAEGQLSSHKCRYLFGCDGLHSFVSQKIQMKYDGFTHLSSSRSIYFYSENLLSRVRDKMCDGHQYNVVRKGVGLGYFALRNAPKNLWTFHLHGLYDGRSPGMIELSEMVELMPEFLGPGIHFEILTDGRWRWSFVVARSFRKGCVFLAGDAAHAWPPFAGNGGNTAYQDTSNLCWKVHARLKGWAGEKILDSYAIERRDMTLRGAIGVLTMTPNPNRLKIAGKALLSPFLRFIAIAHWLFNNSGEHLGNSGSQGGLQMGQLYSQSPIVVGGNSVFCSPEDSIAVYEPKVCTGSRVLHVAFRDVDSIQSLIAEDGYTIIVSCKGNDKKVQDLSDEFKKHNAPVTVVNCIELFASLRPGKRNAYAAKLWVEQEIVICRPDLYIGWTYKGPPGEKRTSWSSEYVSVIVNTLCGFHVDEHDKNQYESVNRWLTWRMIQQMLPMRLIFKNGIFVRNEVKQVEKKFLTKGLVLKIDDKQNDLYRQTSGQEKPAEDVTAYKVDVCIFCKEPLEEGEVCWMNNKAVHAVCLPKLRNQVGVSDKMCKYCDGFLAPGTYVNYNNSQVHERCLDSFKEQRRQDELDAENPVVMEM